MTTLWTDIPKASGNAWTDIAKPVGTTSVVSYTYTGGDPIGLLLALTYSSIIGSTVVTTSKWTTVSENTTSWTIVPKAT